mgnify:CR=1 FL=1
MSVKKQLAKSGKSDESLLELTPLTELCSRLYETHDRNNEATGVLAWERYCVF